MAKKKSNVNWEAIEKWVYSAVLAGCDTDESKTKALDKRLHSMHEHANEYIHDINADPTPEMDLLPFLLDCYARIIVLTSIELRMIGSGVVISYEEVYLKTMESLAK